MTKITTRLRRHPLIDLLFTIKGNPRVCVFIEPLWGIPNSLIAPFTAVYMRAMGISDLQIGLAISLAFVVQVFCAFFGGIIADRLGRKNTTMLGDVIGWVIPCLIWAGAKEYWHFALAMMLNGFEQVNQTAWVCLLIEDAPEKDVLNMWNWVSIAGLMAVFFSPLSGALISMYSLVAVMRVLYAVFGISMIIKCIITLRYTTETTQGLIRRRETAGLSILSQFKGYGRLVPEMIKNSGTMRVLVIMVVLSITAMVNNNFYSLYVTGALGIPENYLAYLPIIRAVVMLVFFFAVQNWMDRFRLKLPMSLGLILYILAQLVVIFSPPQNIVTLICYTLFEAIANGLVFPRKELMAAIFVDKQERARIIALLTTFMMAISAPFGWITGAMSKADGRLPFVLSLSLFMIALLTILTMKENPRAFEPPAEG